VSRLYRGKADPLGLLGEILGEPFRDYRARWEAARARTLIPPFPLHVDYEILPGCNYRCPMCPMSGGQGGGPGGGVGQGQGLGVPLVKRLISDGASRGQAAMGFGGLWEPLLLDAIPELVAHGRDQGLVEALLPTNGSLLTRGLSAGLMEAGLTRLMVSLDAATPATYRLMRPGGSLREVEGNLRDFLALRESRKKRLPLLRVSFVVTSLNEGELPAFVSRWEGLADFISIQRYGHYRGSGAPEALFPAKPHGETPGGLCAQPFKRLLVRHQGDVLPCCDLSAVGMPLGNVFGHSLSELWEGEAMRGLRNSLEGKGTLPGVCRECQGKYQERPNGLDP
jgi:radical SAM protein with 4Fe4S-binding SPASM domain